MFGGGGAGAYDSIGPAWGLLHIGPGGNVLGINFANDGAAVCRTDTGGCYVNTPSNRVWKQLVTLTSMPAGFATIMGSFDAGTGKAFGGTYAVAAAPSSSQRIYMYDSNGDVLVSSNQGATFGTTGFVNTSAAVNGQSDSGWNNKIAIDPQNPDIAIVGTPASGIFKTSNAGVSFAHDATVASGSSSGLSQGGGNLIAFDPSSAVTGGATQGIYCSSYGTGVYHSTNGGVAWTLLNSAGMPTTIKGLAASGDGTVYVLDNSTNSVHIYSGGAWSTGSPLSGTWGGYGVQAVACDPANNGRVVVLMNSGGLSESSNHGTTWSDATPVPNVRVSTDVPWLATTTHDSLADSGCAFDPSVSNTLIVADGLTVWKTSPAVYTSTTSNTIGGGSQTYGIATGLPIGAGENVQMFQTSNAANFQSATVTSYNSGTGSLVINVGSTGGSGTHADWTIRTAQHYTDQGAGIEQLINNRIVVPPGGRPNVLVWDRIQLYSPSSSTYPANQAYVATNPEIVAGSDADYAASTPTFLAGIFDDHGGGHDLSGFSINGGQTWTQFAAKPSFAGGSNFAGSIAASSNQKIAWFPSAGNGSGNKPYFTIDQGATWTACTFPVAVPTTGTTGWGVFFGAGNIKMVAADRVASSTYYAVNNVTNACYRSTDSGANWSKQTSGTIPINGNTVGATSWLQSVPKLGSTDTTGWLFLATITIASDCFVRSKDGGATWSTVDTTFTTVAAFKFGASVNGAVPAVLVVAIKNAVRGIWLSTDDCSTWTNVTKDFNSADQIFDLDGDKDTAGVWYVATNSTGIMKLQ